MKSKEKIRADAYGFDLPSYSEDASIQDPRTRKVPEGPPEILKKEETLPEEPKKIDDSSLTSPLRFIVDTSQVIERVETLLEMAKDARPELQEKIDEVLLKVDELERSALGEGYPEHELEEVEEKVEEGAENPHELISGMGVRVTTEQGDYQGELMDENEDGTWEVKTDKNMTLSNVPAESIVPMDSEAYFTLPASLQEIKNNILAVPLNEFLESKTPEELQAMVDDWKARYAELQQSMQMPKSEFMENAIKQAEDILSRKKTPVVAAKVRADAALVQSYRSGAVPAEKFVEDLQTKIEEDSDLRGGDLTTDETAMEAVFTKYHSGQATADDVAAAYEKEYGVTAKRATLKAAEGSRWYVGQKGGKREAFQAEETPTEEKFPQYAAVVGPFRTKRAADFHVNNPKHQGRQVSEIERMAKRDGSGPASHPTYPQKTTESPVTANKKLKADFMQKFVYGPMDGIYAETEGDGSYFMPWDKEEKKSHGEPTVESVEKMTGERPVSVEKVHGYFARYSAPGYLDATDWIFGETQEAAEAELENIYGLDEEDEPEEDNVKASKKIKAAGAKAVDGDVEVKTERPTVLRTSGDPYGKKASTGRLRPGQGTPPHPEYKSRSEQAPKVVAKFDEKARQGLRDRIKAAKAKKAEIVASAFDAIEVLELGAGWTARRKKGTEKAPEAKTEEAAAPKPEDDLLAANLKAEPKMINLEPNWENMVKWFHRNNDVGFWKKTLADDETGWYAAVGAKHPDPKIAKLAKASPQYDPEASAVGMVDAKDKTLKSITIEALKAAAPAATEVDGPKTDEPETEAPKEPKEEKKKEKEEAEVEVVDPDGKVVATYPDGFGDDTVSVIKMLRQIHNIKDEPAKPKAEAKEELGDKAEAPKALPKVEKEGKAPVEAGLRADMVTTDPRYWDCECEKDFVHPKSEASCAKCKVEAASQPDSRVNELQTLVPGYKAPVEAVKEEDKIKLQAAQKAVEQRIQLVRAMIKELAAKNHILADQADIDEELRKQEEGKPMLEAAMDAALGKAVDRKFKELLALPDAELLTQKAGLPNLRPRVAQVEIKASVAGLEPIDGLTVKAADAALTGGYRLGDAFGAGGFGR